MQNHHLQKSLRSWEEGSHDDLQKSLALLLLVFRCKLNVELLKQCWDLILLEVHHGGKNSKNRIENELIEGTLEFLALMAAFVGPFFGMWVEIVVALVSTC